MKIGFIKLHSNIDSKNQEIRNSLGKDELIRETGTDNTVYSMKCRKQKSNLSPKFVKMSDICLIQEKENADKRYKAIKGLQLSAKYEGHLERQ
jgi:hypothetical protein